MERQESEKAVTAVNSLWYYHGQLRTIWKLCAFGGVFFVSLFAAGVVMFVLPVNAASAYSNLTIMLTATVIATAFGAIIIDGNRFSSVGLQLSGGWIRNFCAGFGIASGMMIVLLLTEMCSGIVEIRLAAVTLGHGAQTFAYGLLLFVLVGFSEELLLRGYPFQTLIRGTNTIVALIITAGLFSILHVNNPNISYLSLINIFLAGIWLGAAYIVSGSLWLPIGLHAGWNFTQGTLLGFPVSGVKGLSILKSVEQGEDWITGGIFGPEGGVLASIILIAGTGLLFHPAFRKRMKFPDMALSKSSGTTKQNGIAR